MPLRDNQKATPDPKPARSSRMRWLSRGSLFLNGVLALFVFSRREDAATVSTADARLPKVLNRTVVERVRDTVEVPGAQKIVHDDWRVVESSDYKEYIRNLRSIGCPEETIRDIVIADVNRMFAGRWKGLMRSRALNYWDPWDASLDYATPKFREEKARIERERDALVQELLHVSLGGETRRHDMNWTSEEREEQLLAFLPEAKRHALDEIRERARRLGEEAQGGSDARPPSTVMLAMSPEKRAELQGIQKAEADEIRAALSPEEYQQYLLRASPSANALRSQLTGFSPSEEEFKTIMQAQLQRDGAVGQSTVDPIDRETMMARAQAYASSEASFQQQVRAALGDERFAEYQRATDSAYRDLVRFAQQQSLPQVVAGKIYEMKQAAETEANRVRRNPDLTPEQRAAALQLIQAETQRSVTGVMGEDAYNSYHARGGYWLRSIAR